MAAAREDTRRSGRPVARWTGLPLLLGLVLLAVPVASQAPMERLSDAEFRSLIDDASEPGGGFHADNFTSNEPYFAFTAAKLAKDGPHGGAYLGVGPEQNFHYIAAIRPAIAVIFDIRRQAVIQHLLFKALFELSADRAEFIARLFSIPFPAGLDRSAPIDELWRQFHLTTPGADCARLSANIADVESRLTRTHGLELSDEDVKSLEYVYDAFFRLGPAIDYPGDQLGLSVGATNFMNLASAADGAGAPRSFLGSDEQYQVVKSLETRNLVVPVQGDFAGPKAVRKVGEFLRERGLTVSAFYISNVEQYLFNPQVPAEPGVREINGGWRAFYGNLAVLPADDQTVLLRVPVGPFIAPLTVQRTLPDGTVRSERLDAFCGLKAFLAAVHAGQVTTQAEANRCGSLR